MFVNDPMAVGRPEGIGEILYPPPLELLLGRPVGIRGDRADAYLASLHVKERMSIPVITVRLVLRVAAAKGCQAAGTQVGRGRADRGDAAEQLCSLAWWWCSRPHDGETRGAGRIVCDARARQELVSLAHSSAVGLEVRAAFEALLFVIAEWVNGDAEVLCQVERQRWSEHLRRAL